MRGANIGKIMSAMRAGKEPQAFWRAVRHKMRNVLREARCVCKTIKTSSRSDDGRNRAFQKCTKARGDFRVSETEIYESKLSAAELALSYPKLFGEFA